MLVFYREESDFENEKNNYLQVDCNAYGRKTVYLKSNFESYNLYFYHLHNVMPYFGYVFKILL